MSEELEAARCAIQHQEKTIATLRKRMEELTDYENGFIKLQKMAFRIQQRAEKAEAKVSDLEGVVAVFHEAGNMDQGPSRHRQDRPRTRCPGEGWGLAEDS